MKFNSLLVAVAVVATSANAQDKSAAMYVQDAKNVASQVYEDNKIEIENVRDKAIVVASFAYYNSLLADLVAARYIRSIDWQNVADPQNAGKIGGLVALSSVTVLNLYKIFQLYKLPLNTAAAPFRSVADSVRTIKNLSSQQTYAANDISKLRWEKIGVGAMTVPKAVLAPLAVVKNGAVSLAINGTLLYVIGYEALLKGQLVLTNEELDHNIQLVEIEALKYRQALTSWIR